MRILSFDSSGSEIQVALVQDSVIVFEKSIPPSKNSRQEAASLLLPAIDSAMKELGWSKDSLDLIAVGVGPGSFTGIRVSVITARSIGQALCLGVMPITRLELLACCLPRPCVVILDAGAGKIYAAAYDDNIFSAGDGQLLAPFYGTTDELYERLSNIKPEQLDNWVLGEGLSEAIVPSSKNVIRDLALKNLAADAGLLACKRLSPNNSRETLAHSYPWDKVLPLYLRSPSITMKDTPERSKSTPL